MNKVLKKSWFTINDRLKKMDYEGDSSFRFTPELAEIVIKNFSKPGDWVIDPFAGFGTTIHSAQKLRRKAIGFEVHEQRAQYAAKGLKSPNRIINDRIENLAKHKLPRFDLLFTSPPYTTVRLKDDPQGRTYFRDIKNIFKKIKRFLKPNGTVVVEVSNLRSESGVRPLAWQVGELLSPVYKFQGEIIRCNNINKKERPGFNHSYLLVYKLK